MKGILQISQFILNAHRMYDGVQDDADGDPHQRFSLVEVEIVNIKTGQRMVVLERVPSSTKISELKDMFERKFPNYYPSRQSFRLDKRSNILKDSDTLVNLNLTNECTLYFDDLGSQIGWRTVFLAQYFPPIIIWLIFYLNIPYQYIWSDYASSQRKDKYDAVFLACICYCGHFSRRVLEVLFLHRFNPYTTMRVMRLTKNCIFYWGTTFMVAYYVNHPMYTSPAYGYIQTYVPFGLFWLLQLGIISIHYVFRTTKTPSNYIIDGSTLIPDTKNISKLRRGLPQPTKYNVFTWLIGYVVCPNYFYELLAWLCFAILTQTTMALIYAILVSLQLILWAVQKKYNYIVEFRDYPKNNYCIIPFLI